MTLTVGLDLVSVESIVESVARYGERFLRRVYTETELRDSRGDPERLAARLAAKEATMKALARDGRPIPWTSIAVRARGCGAARLDLSGPAAALASERGVAELELSLTRTSDHAAAIVIARCGGGGDPCASRRPTTLTP
jgi:holo-[acyl-carrier protein] synthase